MGSVDLINCVNNFLFVPKMTNNATIAGMVGIGIVEADYAQGQLHSYQNTRWFSTSYKTECMILKGWGQSIWAICLRVAGLIL